MLTILCIVVVSFCLYNFVLLPVLNTWGATKDEVARDFPGDELVPGKERWKMTVATTINATPEKIFPYLVQIGQDRGGFYSFDWLERLFGFGIYNTYTIEPQWQQMQAGDFITFHKAGMGMRVHEVVDNKRIIMITNGKEQHHPIPGGKWEMFLNPLFNKAKGHFVAWNWTYELTPLDGGKTRLVLRTRFGSEGNRLAIFVAKHAFAFVSDVMDIEMARRVKKLAEGTYL